jgi:hypothetical protein
VERVDRVKQAPERPWPAEFGPISRRIHHELRARW